MHPSSSGRGPSGGHNPLYTSNQSAHPSGSHSQARAEGFNVAGQGSSSQGVNTPQSGSWYQPSAVGTSAGNTSAHSGTIAGVAPTYTSLPVSQEDHEAYAARQYQQWIDSYEGQQQHQQQAGIASQHASQPHPSSYSFSQAQWPSSAVGPQYAPSSAGMASQPQTGSAREHYADVQTYPAAQDTHSRYHYGLYVSGSTHSSGLPSPQPTRPHERHRSLNPESTHGTGYHQQQAEAYPASHYHYQQQQQPGSQPVSRPSSHHSAGQPQYSPQYSQNIPGYGSHSNPNLASTQSASLSPASWTEDQQATASTNPEPSNLQFKMHNPTPKEPKSMATSNSGPSHLAVPGTSSHIPNESATLSAPPSVDRGSAKRKRIKNDEGDWSPGEYITDSESEDEDAGGITVGIPGMGVGTKGKGRAFKRTRLPGACKHCKKLKMKCHFLKGQNTCERCKAGGHFCIVEGRKARTAPNKREYLLAQIRQKDAIIESLLKQLHNPYMATPLSIASYRMATSPSDHNNHSVLEWLDRLQSSVRDTGSKGGVQSFLSPRDKPEEGSDHEESADQDTEEGDDTEPLSSDEKLRSSLPDSHVPLGLIANLSLSNSKTKNKKKEAAKDAITLAEEDFNDDNVGVANETYFRPGPATDLGIRATLIEQHSPPEILVHGLVTPDDVEKLFKIFYTHVNPFISLLDPVLHTPATTFARCPFLFTVICAISSRYYTEKSEIYPIAMHFAKHSAATALIDGWKSVELCQAYILMSIYAVPARRWEEDRSWLYTGLAIRIATDLNLHHVPAIKPSSEKQEREILNKTRVWMICFTLDRSTATQFGKPSTIKEDFITRSAKEWYRKSQYNHPFDIHLCAYSALLQIVAKFHDQIFSDPSSPTGLNKRVDFRSITLEHDAHLSAFHDEWARRFQEESKADDPGCVFRCTLMPFLVAYSRLVMFSFGFQQAFQRGLQPGDHIFFTKCLDSAKAVIVNMVDGLAPNGYMRYAPDGHFIFASFASAFLLKLLRPEFSDLLKKEQETEIFELISRLIETLSSPKIAIDDRHTPKLYARFLAGLLSRYRRDGATVGRLQTQPPPPHQLPGHSGAGSSTSIFSVSPPHPSGSTGANTGATGGGYGGSQQYTPDANPADAIIYMPEATFAPGTGAIHFGTTDMSTYSMGATFLEGDTLATMQAISNPAWWKNMMMPGFSWPEGSPSPPVSHSSGPSNSPYSSSGAGYDYNSVYNPGYGSSDGMSTMTSMPALTGNFGMFHSTPMSRIPLH